MSAADLSRWLDSIGIAVGTRIGWQALLRGRPDEWTRVQSALQTSPLTLSAYLPIQQYASADLARAAHECNAALGFLNALYRMGDGQSLGWHDARNRYEMSVARFRAAGEAHRLDVLQAIDAWRRGQSPRASPVPTTLRHRACSESVRQRIVWLAEELRRRHDGGGIAQPVRMARSIQALGLSSAYYISSVDNIGSICSLGILPYSLAPSSRADISNQEVQQRRSSVRIPLRGKDRSLHDFSPMFLAAKTPMLWERSDSRTGVGKERLCIVECDINVIAHWCSDLAVTDRNAARNGMVSTSDPEQAAIVPRDVILRGMWKDLPDGGSFRAAELLCFPLIPAPAIARVHVCSNAVASVVRERLHAEGCAVPVSVSCDLFPA
jgi:hypothetical protein